MNEEFVRRFLDGAEPLGRRLESRGTDLRDRRRRANSLNESFGEAPTPVIYLFVPRSSVGARARSTPHARRRRVAARRRRWSASCASSIPPLPVYDVRTLTDHVEKNLFFRRIPARMFVVLGPLLLVLAAIGIYAVVAYTVARRTTEIGVRLALGATAGRVVTQIVGESLRVIGAGALVGWLIAFFVDLHLLRGASTRPCSSACPPCSCSSPPSPAGCRRGAPPGSIHSPRSGTTDARVAVVVLVELYGVSGFSRT